MEQSKASEAKKESILITLEQLSQTIEVMTNVVNRLRECLLKEGSVDEKILLDTPSNIPEDLTNQTIH